MPNNDFNGKLSQDKLNAMLKMAGQKLGMSPQQLQSVLSDRKQSEQLISKLCGQDDSQIKSAAKDPKSLEEYLKKNPRAKKMLEDLLGG
ncbi:MAG TPA: hypothetical protein VHR42_02615 [Clostridia bacterium]|nr:hypothetical protein [Clostridia bacterium]